ADSESVNLGSNPGLAANLSAVIAPEVRSILGSNKRTVLVGLNTL
ncbi:MAG: hypothetical protein ACD_81C00209G0003, partial [uncultured bacterium]